MDTGFQFTYPAECFPRYDYFKRRLKDFVERLKRIMDASGCAGCIPNASQLLEEILQKTELVLDVVNIYIFRDLVDVCIPEIAVNTTLKNNGSEKNTERTFISTKPEFVAIFPKSAVGESPVVTREMPMARFHETKKESTSPVCSVVVFVVSTDEGLQKLYNEISTIKFDSNFIACVDSKNCLRHEDGKWKTITPTDVSLAKNIQTTLEGRVIDIFETIWMLMTQCILRVGKTPTCSLEEVVVQSTRRIFDKDKHILKEIANSVKKQVASSETCVELFKQNVLTAVKKQTRCTLVEILSDKHGIQQTVVLSLLGEGHFELDEKLSDIHWTIYIPFQINKTIGPGFFDTDLYANNLQFNTSELIADADEYIRVKVSFFEKIKKLEFELHGILQMTEIPITTVIPKIHSLSRELREEILRIEEVRGCGHVYGRLLIIVNNLQENNKKLIQRLLRTYRYFHGYTIREMASVVQAGSAIRNGHHLQVEKFGIFTDLRLSRFVYMEFCSGPILDDVYAISCGNCITSSKGPVFKIYRGTMCKFGSVYRYLIYENTFLDSVAIRLSSELINKCNFNIRQCEHVDTVSGLKLYQGKTCKALEVYKHGHRSDLTIGIVVSSDIKHKAAVDESNVNERYYKIIVEPTTDLIQSSPFSKKCDNGSIICVHGPPSDSVKVLVLLCRAFVDPDTQAYISAHTAVILRPL